MQKFRLQFIQSNTFIELLVILFALFIWIAKEYNAEKWNFYQKGLGQRFSTLLRVAKCPKRVPKLNKLCSKQSKD